MQIALNNDYKNNNGRNFQFKKKIIVLTIEGVFQIHGQSRPVTNLPAVDSHSQPRETLTPKPMNR